MKFYSVPENTADKLNAEFVFNNSVHISEHKTRLLKTRKSFGGIND